MRLNAKRAAPFPTMLEVIVHHFGSKGATTGASHHHSVAQAKTMGPASTKVVQKDAEKGPLRQRSTSAPLTSPKSQQVKPDSKPQNSPLSSPKSKTTDSPLSSPKSVTTPKQTSTPSQGTKNTAPNSAKKDSKPADVPPLKSVSKTTDDSKKVDTTAVKTPIKGDTKKVDTPKKSADLPTQKKTSGLPPIDKPKIVIEESPLPENFEQTQPTEPTQLSPSDTDTVFTVHEENQSDAPAEDSGDEQAASLAPQSTPPTITITIASPRTNNTEDIGMLVNMAPVIMESEPDTTFQPQPQPLPQPQPQPTTPATSSLPPKQKKTVPIKEIFPKAGDPTAGFSGTISESLANQLNDLVFGKRRVLIHNFPFNTSVSFLMSHGTKDFISVTNLRT